MHVLPVLWMMSGLPVIGQATQVGREPRMTHEGVQLGFDAATSYTQTN